MKLTLDQEMVDKIFKSNLVGMINTNVEHIRELLDQDSLQQYEIKDLRADRISLFALIEVYNHTNYDPGRWDSIIEELLV